MSRNDDDTLGRLVRHKLGRATSEDPIERGLVELFPRMKHRAAACEIMEGAIARAPHAVDRVAMIEKLKSATWEDAVSFEDAARAAAEACQAATPRTDLPRGEGQPVQKSQWGVETGGSGDVIRDALQKLRR